MIRSNLSMSFMEHNMTSPSLKLLYSILFCFVFFNIELESAPSSLWESESRASGSRWWRGRRRGQLIQRIRCGTVLCISLICLICYVVLPIDLHNRYVRISNVRNNITMCAAVHHWNRFYRSLLQPVSLIAPVYWSLVLTLYLYLSFYLSL